MTMVFGDIGNTDSEDSNIKSNLTDGNFSSSLLQLSFLIAYRASRNGAKCFSRDLLLNRA